MDRTFKREGQTSADFVPIVVFGKSAENCGKYIKKGRMVAVIGRIQTRSWDNQEGIRQYATEVIAAEVDFLDRGSDSKSREIAIMLISTSRRNGRFALLKSQS